MFPSFLDGAKVLEHTVKRHFSYFTDYTESGAPIEKEICYYAICQYKNDHEFYLFGCDFQFDVLTDDLCSSIQDCKDCSFLPKGIIWISQQT